MTYKRLTAMLLAFTMLFGIIVIDTSLYAAASETTEVIEEPHIDVSTADYPIMIDDRINTARLTKIGQYSKLTEEEKNTVCEYYELTDSVFAACEKAGYNILDSVRVAKAANEAEITPAEYKQYITAYGSEEEASFQLRGYKLFEPKISEEYKKEFKALMKEGYASSDLRSTYYVAKHINTSMAKLVPDSPDFEKTSGTKTEIEKFAEKYFCDADKLQKITADKNISTTALIGASKPAVKSESAEISAASAAELDSASATASVSSGAVAIDSPVHSLKHEFVASPSQYFAGENEMVNSVSGGLGYREHIVDLKGRNGLDLDLDLVFSPNSNMYYGETSNGIRTDWYNSSGVDSSAIDTPYGIGWSFNLPFVSYTYERDSLSASAKNAHVWRYHMKDGGAYKIVSDDDGDSATMTLDGYPRDDIQVISESGMVDGIDLSYRVVFADGSYEIFDENGQIRENGDRWGNKITYDYYLPTDGDLEYDEGRPGALGLITDSLGREINIVYQSNPSGDYDRLVNICLPNSTMVQLYLEANSAAQPYILQWINSRPGYTTFTYRSDELPCTDEVYIETVLTNLTSFNTLLNIAAITYNTGLTSRYYYESVDVNNGVGGVKRILRVSERFESPTSADATDISQVLKSVDYYYGTHDYSGYSRRISGPSSYLELYADPNNLPDTFQCFTYKRENMMETQIAYNYKYKPSATYTSIIEEEDGEEYFTMVARETIRYDEYEMPIRYQKADWSYKTIELFESDSKGNVIKSWSTLANGEQNDEYVTTYTYDSTYNLPTSVTYKRDADTTVTETYTLTDDKKAIAKKEISENGTVKERTEYTYDTYGNITRERKYKSDTDYIDINYDYTDTAGVTRPTGTSFAGAYLTRIWQNGGNDIDGTAIGDVEYKYEYDVLGRKVKETDPLGNSTSYTYDRYNRITKITNPDNTTRQFAYTLSTTANETLHTDEVGTQTKYVYDPAHNLKDVIDVTSGESLQSYDYDRWYNMTAERNVQLLTSGYETTYTYDKRSRVIAKETKNSDDVTVAKEVYDYDFGESRAAYRITTRTIVGDDTYAPSITTKEYVDTTGNVEKIGYVTGTNEYFTTYKYDYWGNKTEELAAIADQKDWTNTFTTKWEYDHAGRVVKEYDANGNYISYEYDWLGRPTKYYDRVANTKETPYYTAYQYDNLGNVIQETVPQTETTNKVTKFKYDKLGRVTLEKKLYDIVEDAEQYQTVSYAYDWRGNVTTATQDIYPTTYTYDNLGRCLTSTTDGKTTTYTYDRFGNVLTETFAGKTDTYTYDMNNFRTKHVDRTGKRTSYEPNALQKIYSIMTSAESGGRTFEYTLTGQLLIALDRTGVGVVRRWYDDRGNAIKEENTGIIKDYTYDIEGKRESFAGETLNLTYTYNVLGQLTAVNSGETAAVSYTYDANGNLLSEIKSAVSQTYTYNRDGTESSIATTNNIDNTTKTNSYTYYNNGNVRTETLPDNTTKSYVYNSRNMLVSEALSSGKTTAYNYDGSGNRTSMTETENSQNTVTSYIYDTSNRLTEEHATQPDNTVTSIYYTYDDDGNLTQRSYGSADAELATSVDTFAYNGYGELSQAVVNGVTTSYTYYADGLRRTKATSGVTTLHMWDGENIAADLDGSYAVKNTYIRGLRLAEMSDGTDSLQYAYNRHGDVEEFVDKTTGTVTDYSYDAYGNQETVSTADVNPFRYSGEYYDAETGFIYLRARYYDPTIGRFISEDPIRDGLNWYVYCNNNPINRIDPSGLKDYIYTSQTKYYVENDWGFWEFLNMDRYYAEIDGSRYQANSKETVTLYDWSSFDTKFLNETLDSLVDKANEKPVGVKRILSESVGGDLDFKLQMEKGTLYLANGVLYNRNEAGNFVWAYYLESQNVSGYISGALAQGGSLIPPLANMNGLPRLDEEWDRKARWAGIKHYYDRNNWWWIYYALYGGKTKY